MAKVDIGLVRSDLGQQQVHGCDPIAVEKKEAYPAFCNDSCGLMRAAPLHLACRRRSLHQTTQQDVLPSTYTRQPFSNEQSTLPKFPKLSRLFILSTVDAHHIDPAQGPEP
jgi:hypothetical protein